MTMPIGSESRFAFDIETSSLTAKPENHRLTAIMSEVGDDVTLMNWDETQQWLISTDNLTIIGHNIVGFDLKFFDYSWDRIKVWDTMLMSKMLNRSPGYLHRLDECLRRIGIIHTEKDLDVVGRDWDIHDLTDREINYIRQDVAHLWPLFHALYDLLDELDLLDNCRLEHQVRRVSNIMERNGLPIRKGEMVKKEREAYAALPKLNFNSNSYQQISDEILGVGVQRERRLEACKKAGIPVKAHKTTGRVYIGTNEECQHRCVMNGINPPVVKKVIEAKKAGAPLKHIKWMREALQDGKTRMHSRFDNLGTNTGRYSASNKAIQQMNKNLRTCFGFEEGEPYVIIKADWSQMELRLHAALNNDIEMTAILEDETADIHSLTASRAFNTKEPTSKQRDLGKTTNFSLLYLAGWKKLWARLIQEGHYVPAETAQDLWEAFHKEFPTVRKTGDRLLSKANITFPDNFPIRIWGGLVRWMEWQHDTENGLINFPLPAAMNTYIQGAGGAVLKRSLLDLPESTQECLAATVHDEIVVVCREEEACSHSSALQSCMETNLREALWPTKIPPKVDVTVGKTWGG